MWIKINKKLTDPIRCSNTRQNNYSKDVDNVFHFYLVKFVFYLKR